MAIVHLPLVPQDFPRLHHHFQSNDPDEHVPRSPTPDEIAELHSSIRTQSLDALHYKLLNAGLGCGASAPQILCMAVEPSTGNTLLHTAVAAQRLDVMARLLYAREFGEARYQLAHDLIVFHRNLQGDTILHVAVGTGSLELVIATYRALVKARLPGVDGGNLRNAPEDRDWYCQNERYMEARFRYRVQGLMFLLAGNAQGSDAVTEARERGHEDIVGWLDRLLERYDPHRERDDPDKMQSWQVYREARFEEVTPRVNDQS